MMETNLRGGVGAGIDGGVLYQISLRYGLICTSISVPFTYLGLIILPTLAPKTSDYPSIGTFFVPLAVILVLVWTFAVPVIVSVFLLMTGRKVRNGDASATTKFIQAYKLMQVGGVLSLMPFFVLGIPAGFIWSVFTAIGMTSPSNASSTGGVLFGVGILSVIYYWVFFRIENAKGRLVVAQSDNPD